MKEKYKVQKFSLKRIVENLDKIPNSGKFDEAPKLTKEQKRKLMEMVGKLNEYGKTLRCEDSIVDTAKALAEIAELAETYACNEAGDWFQTETIKRDFKDLKGRTQEFQKLARETYSGIQRLNAIFEDAGHILSRYYEIRDIEEILRRGPAVDQNPVDRERQSMDNSTPELMETDVDEIRKSPVHMEDPLHDVSSLGRP